MESKKTENKGELEDYDLIDFEDITQNEVNKNGNDPKIK